MNNLSICNTLAYTIQPKILLCGGTGFIHLGLDQISGILKGRPAQIFQVCMWNFHPAWSWWPCWNQCFKDPRFHFFEDQNYLPGWRWQPWDRLPVCGDELFSPKGMRAITAGLHVALTLQRGWFTGFWLKRLPPCQLRAQVEHSLCPRCCLWNSWQPM